MAFMGPGAPREGASRYAVTSADGQWLGTVTAPPGLRILDAATAPCSWAGAVVLAAPGEKPRT